MNYELSICIPARNEVFLKNTIEDIVAHKEAKTEVIAVLDGEWANPPIEQHPDVKIIYVPESIGQRAAQNMAVRLSKAKWVAKMDAHVSIDQGFDRKMIEFMEKHQRRTCMLLNGSVTTTTAAGQNIRGRLLKSAGNADARIRLGSEWSGNQDGESTAFPMASTRNLTFSISRLTNTENPI